MIVTMPALVSTLSIALALHPGAAPDHSHGQQQTARSTTAARQQAGQAFKRGEYVAAATHYETLWQREQEPRDLFNAGLAWFAAGEHALAVLRFETYIELGDRVPSEYVARAETQLARAKQHTVEVAVTVIPPAASKGEVRLQGTRQASATPGGLPSRTLEFSPPRAYGAATRAVTTIRVDPGQWRLTLEATGYRPASRAMTVQAGQGGFTMDIELQADPSQPRPAAASGRAPSPVGAPATEIIFALPPETHEYVEGDIIVTASEPGRADLGGQRCTIPVLFPEPPGTCSLRLAPGTWQISASGPGIDGYSTLAELRPGAATQRVLLPVEPAPEEGAAPPPEPSIIPVPERVKLSRNFSIAGTVAAVAGLTFTIVGDIRYGDAEGETNTDVATRDCARANADGLSCQARLIGPMRLRSAGLGMFGGAAGLYATAATIRYDVKPRVWFAEIGVGAALTVGGAIWLIARTPTLDQQMSKLDINFDDISRIGSLTAERMAGSLFLGAGVGLLTGSVTGLMIQRKHLNAKTATTLRGLTPYWTRGGAGLSLSGRF